MAAAIKMPARKLRTNLAGDNATENFELAEHAFDMIAASRRHGTRPGIGCKHVGPGTPLEIAVDIGTEGSGKGRPVDASRRVLEGRNLDGLQGTGRAFRGLVPDLGDLPVQVIRLAMQRLGADRGDESLDGAVVDAGRRNAAFTGVAGEPRQAEMGTSGRKLLQQGLPRRAQGHPGGAAGRMEAARLHGGQEMGPKVVKGLRRHASGRRAQFRKLGTDRR